MKAIINGIEIEGTPAEMAELLMVVEKAMAEEWQKQKIKFMEGQKQKSRSRVMDMSTGIWSKDG